MQINLERKLIEKFFTQRKKDRYFNFIEKEKTRKKFLNELYHFKDFDWRLFEKIPGSQNPGDVILKKLTNKKNITSCYVISVDEDFDGKTFPIKQAIEEIMWIEGTIKIFGEVEVVYYESEPPDGRFISV